MAVARPTEELNPFVIAQTQFETAAEHLKLSTLKGR